MKTIHIIILLLASASLIAQKDVEFDKKNFKNQKSELKEALKNIKQADDFMQPSPVPRYTQAIPLYLAANKFNPNNSYVNYQLGLCYMNTINKFQALDFFKKAYALNPKKFPDIHYYIGRGYHLNMKWDDAIASYSQYKKVLDTKKDAAEIAHADKLIQECRAGKELVLKPVRVWIDNMGPNVNTEYPEYAMIMTADASEIFFTSRRPSTTGGGMDEFLNEYFEDVYTARRKGKNEWSKATNIGSPINTKGHDAAVALSPDGSKMIVYIDDNGDGNLYESYRKGDSWSKPKKFNKEISGPYHEPSAWYSSDMKLLYFVSDRPDNNKGPAKDKDIYVATWNEKKEKWDNVEKLPANVNTSYDEDGIFLHPDGRTLYFSSKGHNTMGGYDVFKTVKNNDGTWSDPVNVGFPINTPDDDVFFVVAANGRHAYMTSFREDGFGGRDLYKVTLLGVRKEPVLQTENRLIASSGTPVSAKVIEPKVELTGSRLAILKGIVRDDKTKKPIQAEIELVDNVTGEVLAEFRSDEVSGRFLVSLPAGKNYGIAVKADGYLFHSENFDIQEDADYKEVEKLIDLKKAEVGQVIVLRNIFFDLAKYSLRSESKNELDRLIKLLEENPKLKIEISGHTDSRGSASLNKTLSENRAKAVVDYLVENGVQKNRLTHKGYGKDQPIVTDEAISKLKTKQAIEDAHQENRRTEFKIISN
ncbi:MAG: OmpA family protein [Crocinitomicaceae bacterium]|nr:OmpA family protein [Crocinitomicaceae bacterium]